jgi:hypothetical protein
VQQVLLVVEGGFEPPHLHIFCVQYSDAEMRSWDVSKEGVHGLGAERHETGRSFWGGAVNDGLESAGSTLYPELESQHCAEDDCDSWRSTTSRLQIRSLGKSLIAIGEF